MDASKRIHSGLEDERAFSETLVTDHSIKDQHKQPPETKNAEPAPEKTKSGTKQPPWVGKIMGHFKLLRLIGEGAMGLVIQAEDTHLKRIVALKVLRKQLTKGEKGKAAVEQFLREARAAASIDHPNIVRVYEINQHADWWYIAMEMVSGNSLQEIVKAVGALPASRACPIIADAATALQVAHEVGMIHRDIKPSNILVTRNGHGKISDFGLVRIDDPNDPLDIYAHQSIGTPFYMAPEIIQRQTIGSAVDIYSLGATLYYTLTGRPPFMAEQMRDVLLQHVHSEPPNLLSFLPEASPNLATLIKRMMAKQPDIRPNASEVAAMLHAEAITFFAENQTSGVHDAKNISLEQALQQLTQTSGKDLTQQTLQVSPAKRFKLIVFGWLVAAVTVVLVTGGLIFQFYTSRTPKQNRLAVDRLFPQAPRSYGTSINRILPDAVPLVNVPAFSWKDKVDTSGIHFVASQTGRYYYPIDDKRALLIRADQFVKYETAEQAINDAKQPAP